MKDTRISFEDIYLFRELSGSQQEHFKRLEDLLKVKIKARGSDVVVFGESFDVDVAENVLHQLYSLLKEGYPLYPSDIDYAVRIVSQNKSANLKDIFLDAIYMSSKKKVITPKTIHQKNYVDAIRNYDIVFGIGPAGTGKTYLAMAMAIHFLTRHRVERIVLTRPAVEAGERLGFLPGDIQEKVNPYLRPLYDALYDMVDYDRAKAMMERGIIEIAPLAFMRGRTLTNAFIILDEAQNTGREQMKMFLTRLGFGSKAVVTGDITQIDLPKESTSGLVEAQHVLKNVKGIKFCYFDETDVVRHRLVSEVIKAYGEYEESLRGSSSKRKVLNATERI